ncbi:MAG TPA: aminotransferase class I/II-fold pyridoxal phosphate-dependent enzyme [Planctomycetes bacterium]|nr:aminotransferase class I/II-fold pyridoxal phosphate-dependent enzyme [Planctomycetota bacterium]
MKEHIDRHLGTFSKAAGTIGGFAAGDEPVIQYIRFHAPTYVFTRSTPPPVVAATSASLRMLQRADDRRRKLGENARRLQEGLRALHLDPGNTQSPITPSDFRAATPCTWPNSCNGYTASGPQRWFALPSAWGNRSSD